MKARVERIPVRPTDFVSYIRATTDGRFFEYLSRRTGMDELTGYPSCRAAIYNALEDCGVEQGDEVLVPAYTCHAVFAAVDEIASPTLVEVNRSDFNMNIDSLKEKASPDSTAVVPVHAFGNMCEMAAIKEIADDYEMVVVEDAAQGLGTLTLTDEIGSYSDYCVFSLRFSKDMTCVKGGVLAADEPLETPAAKHHRGLNQIVSLAGLMVADELLSLLPGRIYNAFLENVLSPYFESSSSNLGSLDPVNFGEHMSALLDSQFGRLDERIEARRRNASVYHQHLDEKVVTPSMSNDHSYFRYPILVRNGRDKVLTELRQSGIGCSNMYSYALSAESNRFPNAETLADEVLNLPVHSGLTKEEVTSIAEEVNELIPVPNQ